MTQATASADELRAWLKLTMTPKLGTAQAMLLLSEFGLPQQILDHSLSQLSRYVSMEVAQALKADLDEQSHQLIEISFECLCNLHTDRKSTRLNSSHVAISYAVFCLKKKNIAIGIQDLSISSFL